MQVAEVSTYQQLHTWEIGLFVGAAGQRGSEDGLVVEKTINEEMAPHGEVYLRMYVDVVVFSWTWCCLFILEYPSHHKIGHI